MQTETSSVGIRRSGNFCTGVALLLVTFFSSALPTTADPHTAAAIATSVPLSHKSTKISDSRQVSRPRRIEIDLSQQRLKAWEGKKLVYSFRISTGKRATPTPIGRFHIQSKYRKNRMRGRGYDIPDVPYAMYFYQGYAIHGAYWHNRFGTPVSHGCVNLPVQQARKLYNWTKPGTLVLVQR